MIQVKQGPRSIEHPLQVTLGSGHDADFFINDSILAPKHLEVRKVAGGGYVVRDLDTVSGTYVGGEPITEHALADGDEIVVGVTVVRVKIKGEGDTAALALTVRPGTFAFDKPKEGAFANDPDRWVQSEQKLSRFPALKVGNRLMVIGAAVGFVFLGVVSSAFETISDPGPLAAAHATLFDPGDSQIQDRVAGFAAAQQMVEDQSCNVCHEGGATPQRLCMVCHDDLADQATRRHPFHGGAELASVPGLDVDEGFCVRCHTDHEGSTAVFKKGSEAWTGDCASCHGTKLPETPPPPVVASVDRVYSSVLFPHDAHTAAGMDCTLCHVISDSAREIDLLGFDDPAAEDFAEVPFETCAECHVADSTPRPEIVARQVDWLDKAPAWAVRWHGSEDGEATCGQCHSQRDAGQDARFGPEFLMVERARGSHPSGTRGVYEIERRSHDDVFAQHSEGKACTECHRSGRNLGAIERPLAAPFWHALHMPDLAGATESQCLACHSDLGESDSLAGAPGWWRAADATQQECARCHFEMDGDSQRPTEMVATSQGVVSAAVQTVVQFPHRFHTGLEGGCATCHGFEKAPGQDSPFALVATTDIKAADCRSCHGGHDNVAGGDCQKCHPGAGNDSRAPVNPAGANLRDVYWIASGLTSDPRDGAAPLADALRPWPEQNSFSHLSSGHVNEDCTACHGLDTFKGVTSLRQVPAPDESMQLCRDCHLKQQFHWR